MRTGFIVAGVIGLSGLAIAGQAAAHPGHDVIAEWSLVPEYTLPAQARNVIGAMPEQPTPKIQALAFENEPMLLFGERPTERRRSIVAPELLVGGTFTAELWILDHVNQPAGVLATLREAEGRGDPVWALAYHNDTLHLDVKRKGFADSSITVTDKLPRFKNYWRHVVATHDGRAIRLYVNGRLAGELKVGALDIADDGPALDLELAAYMQNEPYMDLENMLKFARISHAPAGEAEVASRFEVMRDCVTRGLLHPSMFHFNAGPYLHMATPTTINLTWETSSPATATISYYKPGWEPRTVTIAQPGEMQELTLEGLEPGQNYMYRVTAAAADGQTLDSGLLTFKTAELPGENQPIRFAVLGDTEARPHINDRIAKLAWNERPDFALCVGDLTDGGQQDRKFEWNHEYFLGLNQLTSRVPMYPVPGNGESDLHWYSRYHKLPSEDAGEGYYTFTYGDIQFFMLDSNRSDQFGPGGTQYAWLERELQRSTATWKIACHHHPTFTSDEDDYGNTFQGEPSPLGDANVQKIITLYETYGVDLVFFGHLHTYERSLPIKQGKPQAEGVTYIQCGGAGGNLEDFAPTPSWFSGKTHRGHHFVMVEQWAGSLDLRMVAADGAILDRVELRKPAPAPK